MSPVVADLSKPAPPDDPVTAPFWAAVRQRRLVAPKCQACKLVFLYPRVTCPRCLAREFQWLDLSGRGRVYSCTVVRQAAHPAFVVDVPYVFAVIELDEGPRLASNVVGCPPEEVAPDQPVEVLFEDRGDHVVPLFRPTCEGERHVSSRRSPVAATVGA